MKAPFERVLITGGAGFIGSHLVESLVALSYHVLVLDDMSTGSPANLAAVAEDTKLQVHVGSVTDSMLVNQLASEVDAIIHLGAAVGVELIINEPIRTITTNVRGTENVLEAAARNGHRVFVASTSEVYGKGVRYPFNEEDDVVLGSTSKNRWAYAATKMVDEFLCFAYYREHNLTAVPIRLFNTVGARQTGRYGMVIPRLVRQALLGEDLTVFGDGTQQRCFCDVRDVVRALVGLVEHAAPPIQTYNVGGTEEVSILQLAERIIAISESPSGIRLIPYHQAYPPGFEDMQRRIPDTGRIRHLLDWVPQYDLDDIIASVIAHEQRAIPSGVAT